MKILYLVINGEITGGNIVCLNIIENALKRGHDVIVNSPTEGKFTDILRKIHIKVYNVNTSRSFRLDNAIKLARIIKKERVGLLHTHTPLSGTILGRIAGSMAKIPVVNHAHTEDFMNLNPLIKCCQFSLNWITSRFFCTRVIAVSESVKIEIIKQGVVPHKIVVIHNGVNADNFKVDTKAIENIRNEFGLKQNQRVIGEISRLCETKGQHTLIKSASKVIKNNPDTVFMIIGEDLETKGGNIKKQLEDLTDDLGLKQQVIFTGYRQDIMDLLNTFDFFVFPSLLEGLPVVILEAMAAKKPVITTPVGGNPEIVIDGETGTLVPPQDPDKLAEAIIYHLNHPEISKQMGERGYERVKQYFSLSEMLEKVFSLYNSVLSYH